MHARRSVLSAIIFGVLVGILLSLLTGIGIVFLDITSRVRYVGRDDSAQAFAWPPNLLETLDASPEDRALRDQANSDFEMLQQLIGQGTVSRAERNDDPTNATPSRGQETPGLTPIAGTENFMLFGVDARDNSYRGRADVTMLISVNHPRRTVNFVSLMRGMYVNIGIRHHEWGMLNAAYSYGGPALAVRTVERNFGIPIKGFVAVNFNSFRRIVDAAGGVDIVLTDAEARYLGMTPGAHHMNGQEALNYARIRKIDSDFQRNGRQRKVIFSLLASLSRNPTALYNAATVALANTYTDLDLNRYLSQAPTYLSYSYRELQLPHMSETKRFFQGGREMWWVDLVKTHRRLITFLQG